MTVWIGVFAKANGWCVAQSNVEELYIDREEAVAAAIRLALLAEWRGEDARVLAQADTWGSLSAVDLRTDRDHLRAFH
ncbi:hypothetical protein M9M90_20980 (plasmid) [Phenylobacterium sp. LH3H17]|uniref:hypothetical protein n=1 Tax=Phenylobacterium sp. LH3H17 TaxID=2903901 RepID=UPI0020C9F9FF|nr:hypothetical protein [Phenylobacterium sp. LH3H17]UTP41702.1 hypothetical protein M9M90_20980 [Phenylobacterium sp. LH3H17]